MVTQHNSCSFIHRMTFIHPSIYSPTRPSIRSFKQSHHVWDNAGLVDACGLCGHPLSFHHMQQWVLRSVHGPDKNSPFLLPTSLSLSVSMSLVWPAGHAASLTVFSWASPKQAQGRVKRETNNGVRVSQASWFSNHGWPGRRTL